MQWKPGKTAKYGLKREGFITKETYTFIKEHQNAHGLGDD